MVHFFHFDPRFCGQTGPLRLVTTDPDRVTCPACRANIIEKVLS